MAKSHLKRLAAPRTWKIKRKGLKFVSRPQPGPHKIELCMPLNIILRDVLGYAKTAKEVKHILTHQEVLVDGRRRKEPKFGVGFMDVLWFKGTKEAYRMMINSKGYLTLLPINEKEAGLKPYKIMNKTVIKGGKTQLNLSNGTNVLVDKDTYKTGETLVMDMPELKVQQHLKLEKGAYLYLMGGIHIGDHGVVTDIMPDAVMYKSADGQEYETNRRFAIVIGKDKPLITLAE